MLASREKSGPNRNRQSRQTHSIGGAGPFRRFRALRAPAGARRRRERSAGSDRVGGATTARRGVRRGGINIIGRQTLCGRGFSRFATPDRGGHLIGHLFARRLAVQEGAVPEAGLANGRPHWPPVRHTSRFRQGCRVPQEHFWPAQYRDQRQWHEPLEGVVEGRGCGAPTSRQSASSAVAALGRTRGRRRSVLARRAQRL